MKLLTGLRNAFPLWVIAGSIAALVDPPLFTWFSGGVPAAIMLGMAVTQELGEGGCDA